MSTTAATLDLALSATVISISPLRYTAGPDSTLDRPGFVRAGSSLAWVGNRLAVIQDDANFVALIDPVTSFVDSLPLPAGEGNLRLFDDSRGTKYLKLDLEACISVGTSDDAMLLAFGSGSTERRERVAIISGWHQPEPSVAVVDASALYAHLRANTDFAGAELNIEGAALLGETLRLFARGNGPDRDGIPARPATCDLAWPQLHAFLANPQQPPPLPTNVVQYDLGTLDGLRLGFTDATAWSSGVLFAATAEDSPDVTKDGIVSGSVLGLIDADGRARLAILTLPDGSRFAGKVEGVASFPNDPSHVCIVVDSDLLATPSDLCIVALQGPWTGED